jgi:hypothetical protein
MSEMHGDLPIKLFKKSLIKKVYCGKCIENKKNYEVKKEKNEKENSIV